MGNNKDTVAEVEQDNTKPPPRVYNLTLLDYVILLCVRENGSFGAIAMGAYIKTHLFALTTAIMMELVLRGRLEVVSAEKEDINLKIVSTETTGVVLLDTALTYMSQFENGNATNRVWLKNIPAGPGVLFRTPGIPNLLVKSLDALVEKGILRKETGVIVDRYPFVNETVKNDITRFLKSFLASPSSPYPFCVETLYYILDRFHRTTIGQPLDQERLFANRQEKENHRARMDEFFQHKLMVEDPVEQRVLNMVDSIFRYNILWQSIFMAVY